jgi:splicing factor U2AF subunit
LSTSLSEDTVRDLLLLFGPLKDFNLVRDSLSGASKGFAFCEYQDPNITETVCKVLNGMTFGDSALSVRRANNNPKALEEAAKFRVDPRAAAMLTLSTPANQLLATAVKDPSPVITRILILMNIVNTTDFPGDKVEAEYGELMADMKTEMSRYGRVLKIVIPRPAKKIIHDSVEHFAFKETSQTGEGVPGL